MKSRRGQGWRKLSQTQRSDRAKWAAQVRWANATPEQRKDTGAALAAARKLVA